MVYHKGLYSVPFYSFYVNDISWVSNKIFPILYAGDTTILMEGNSIHNVIASLDIELHKLNVSLKLTNCQINIAKHISWCFTVQDERISQ